MLLALLVACGGETVHMIPVPAAAPDNVREACAVASRKCSGCHDVERITSAHHDAHEWQVTVDRMRMIPGGAISEPDAAVIMSCLVYVAVPPAEDTAPPAATPATTAPPAEPVPATPEAPAAPAAPPPATPAGSAS